MTDDKTRAALEAAREELQYYKVTYAGGLTDQEISKTQVVVEQISEVLNSGPALNEITLMRQELEQLQKDLFTRSGGHIRSQLLTLPDQIRTQSLEVAKTAELIEMERSKLDKKKNEHLTFVLSATENGKPKFTNEQARRAAVESLIAEDTSYAEVHDSLTLKEALLKRQEIDLEHLRNLFRAYLAIAGMQGVR